ncbi:MAG: hypothetical protein ACPGU5_01935 [Lishizhenia sp.]
MKIIFALFFLVALISACNSTDKSSNENALFSDYFYPNRDKTPVIYVYQDSVNGLNEKFFRTYTTKGEDQDYFNVERYTADFRITEAYQYSLKDSLLINDHMVVDAYGEKRKAKLNANFLLPKTLNDESFFSSNFPSQLDSVIMIYDVKSSVINPTYPVVFDGKTYDGIMVRDSIKYQVFNPITKKAKSTVVAQNSIYAKGIGLYSYGSVKNTILFQLQKILTEEEWRVVKETAM